MLPPDDIVLNDQVPSQSTNFNHQKFTNTQCFVVGYGHMGTKVAEVLTQLGYTPFLIDLKFDSDKKVGSYRSIAEIPIITYTNSAAWFICTPTETHLAVFREIKNHCPHARIMIEKPVCTSKDIIDFYTPEIIANAKDLWIDNHYEDCINLSKAVKFINSYPSRIVSLTIEFSKNRSDDINNGRFVDNDFMLWGYEGFHMLYIASQLLSPMDGEYFIDGQGEYKYVQGQEGHVSWITETSILPSGTKVNLRTATDGSIFHGDIKCVVLVGKQRKRRVKGCFEDGSEISLCFAEDKHIEYAPSDEYSFCWTGVGPEDKIKTFWTKDNPLRNHIARFLNTNSDTGSNFDLGIKLTTRLSKMASKSYRFVQIIK